MRSPRAEWSLGIGYLVLVDILRDRGEPDGDTLSEVTREVFRVHTPRGRLAWLAVLVGGGALLDRHICKETPWASS